MLSLAHDPHGMKIKGKKLPEIIKAAEIRLNDGCEGRKGISATTRG
jgi:hypothetical protein